MDATSVLIFRMKALEHRLQYLLDTVEPKPETEIHWIQQELARTITERLRRVRETTRTAKATRDSWNDVIAQQKACASLFGEALAFLRVQDPCVVDGSHGTGIRGERHLEVRPEAHELRHSHDAQRPHVRRFLEDDVRHR